MQATPPTAPQRLPPCTQTPAAQLPPVFCRAEADKQRRAEALAAQRQRDVAAELLAQLEAAQRGQARSGAAAAAQIDELQRRQQPG